MVCSTVGNFANILPPIANPDYYTVAENTTNTFTVTTNDVVVSPGRHCSGGGGDDDQRHCDDRERH
jgi:hypothetical protein